MNLYIISTERLRLRRWLPMDREPFSEMNSDPTVMKYFQKTNTHGETLEMIERINLQFEKTGWGLFAVEDKSTETFVGYTGFAITTF